MLASFAKSQQDCGEDFSPCTCTIRSFTNEREVKCEGVHIDGILQIFNRTSAQPSYCVGINLLEGDIPADLFSDKQLKEVYFTCNASDLLLTVDSNALRSSRSYLAKMEISNCNLLQMDSNFLEGFDRLWYLEFGSTFNLQQALATLPTLRSLDTMLIDECANDFVADMEYDTSVFAPVLHTFSASYNNWNEDTIGWLVDWLVNRNSTENIWYIDFNDNAMTKIPPEMALIGQFGVLHIIDNTAPMTVESDSFNFNQVPCKGVQISLSGSNITDIQPGAFQSNFSCATQIYLSDNNLTRFEEDVFYPILEKFASTRLYHHVDVRASIGFNFK